jgi:hypothetical protein
MSVAGRSSSVLLLVTLGFGALPAATAAQSVADAPSYSSAAPESVSSSPRLVIEPASSSHGAPLDTLPQFSRAASNEPRGVLVPLYVSFAALQVLDAHSTLRAIDAGATERNPVRQGIVNQPAALLALKGGVAASTIFVVDKIRHRSRVGAIITMAALNSLYATVVAHNYRTVR